MNYQSSRIASPLAAAIAFAQPVAFIAQEASKAVEILAAARKAIGDKKLDALKTFRSSRRFSAISQTTQINSDVEIVLDLPDKYLRQETAAAAAAMVLAGGGVSGLQRRPAAAEGRTSAAHLAAA